MTHVPVPVADPTPLSGWRTRVAGVALGGVGVLLAASTTVWPTKIVAVRVPEVGDFTKGYEQLIWSWGREVVYTSDGVLLDAFSGPDPVPRLVLLVVVLLLAAAGLAARLVRAGRPGELAAGVGLALALATVAGSVVQRLSVDDRTIGLQPGLVVVTTTVGWLEVVSVVVLTAALAGILVPVLLPRVAASVGGRAAHASARLTSRRHSRATDGRGDAPAAPSATRPVAALREVAPPGTTHTPSVGFSDDGDGPAHG
jgi:hypothetical protein